MDSQTLQWQNIFDMENLFGIILVMSVAGRNFEDENFV